MTEIVFVFGLLWGSFLNVVAFRVPKEESLLFPPSHCTTCSHRLYAIDLIPVFSFLLARGKCRYCGQRISIQYPLVELITALGFVLVWTFAKPSTGVDLIVYLLNVMFFSVLLVIFIVDSREMIIPDEFNLALGVLALIKMAVLRSYWTEILGLFVCGSLILLIVVLTKGMGMGDAKMFAAIGLWFGLPQGLFVMFLSIVLGAILSIALLAFGIKSKKDRIPFGPFISIAAFIGMLYAEPILAWYFQYFII